MSDSCLFDASNDEDSDALCGITDSCRLDASNDADADLVCDDVDSCLEDVFNDADSDRLCAVFDHCPFDADNDIDSDAVCGEVDSCPSDSFNDDDSDRVCGEVDSCPADSSNDPDSDGICARGVAEVEFKLSLKALSEMAVGNASDAILTNMSNSQVSELVCRQLDTSCSTVAVDRCTGAATTQLPDGTQLKVKQQEVVTTQISLVPTFNFTTCQPVTDEAVENLSLCVATELHQFARRGELYCDCFIVWWRE